MTNNEEQTNELDILYEDNHIIVVLKPQMTACCPDESKDDNLLDMIKEYIKITYIKKPRLFSYDLDQMSDMTITPEFVDMVVSDILLILKDNTFNLVKQQTNIE